MRILIVSTMRNEGPFILDWIAHHRAMGATDFLIYTNDCDDGTDVLLDKLDQLGIVHHVRNEVGPDEKPQWKALKHAWKHPLRKETDWALVLDVDEYVIVHEGKGDFADLFEACPDDAEAITLPWRLFGCHGIAQFADRPVTEQFLKSAPDDMVFPVAAQFFKTIFQPKAAFHGFGVHRPKQKQDGDTPHWISGAGERLDRSVAAHPKRLNLTGTGPNRSVVECHHYSLRSIQSFLVKADRGLPNHVEKPIDLAYWVRRNFNQVENKAALRRMDASLAEKERLLAMQGVRECHDACFGNHKSKIRALLKDRDMIDLYTNILVAGPSATIPVKIARHISDLYQAME